MIWSISVNTCIISDQLRLQPILEWLTWFIIKKSKQFNHSDIASDIAALTLTLSVNGPLSSRSGSLCMLFAFKLFHSYEYCIQYIHNPSASCYFWYFFEWFVKCWMYVNFLSSSDVPSLHHDIAILTASCCVTLHCNPPVQKYHRLKIILIFV